MTETKPEYTPEAQKEIEALKAQIAQLQNELQSAFSLIGAYENAADLLRATMRVMPHLMKQGDGNARQ